MFFGLFGIAALLVVLIIVLIARPKKAVRLTWAEIGTIIDRTVRAYRRQLLPFLALAAICTPIGAITYGSAFSLFFNSMQLDLSGHARKLGPDDRADRHADHHADGQPGAGQDAAGLRRRPGDLRRYRSGSRSAWGGCSRSSDGARRLG